MAPTVTVTAAGETAAVTYGQTGTPFTSLARKPRVDATAQQVPLGGTVSFPAGVLEDPDFIDPANYPVYCMYFGARSLQGAAIDETVFQIRAGSSTKAGLIPLQSAKPPAPTTNPLYVMRVDGSVSLSDFTLRGTAQPINPNTGKPHTYNGLVLYQGLSAKVSRIKVVGIPGDNAANPGETFGFNDYKGNGSFLDTVEIDGLDAGGSNYGGNSVNGATIVNSFLHNAGFGAGATQHLASGQILYRNVRATGNRVAFNFEKCVAGITIDSCDMRGAKTSAHIVIDSDLGSSKLTIIDPVTDDGTVRVCIHGTYPYPGPPNKQLASDVSLIVAGKPRPDLLRIVPNYS